MFLWLVRFNFGCVSKGGAIVWIWIWTWYQYHSMIQYQHFELFRVAYWQNALSYIFVLHQWNSCNDESMSFWLRLRSTTHHEIGSWSVGQQPRWWTCCWNTSEKKVNPLKLEVTKSILSYWRWILHGTGILFKSFLPILPSLPLEGSFEASKLIRVSLLEVASPRFIEFPGSWSEWVKRNWNKLKGESTNPPSTSFH